MLTNISTLLAHDNSINLMGSKATQKKVEVLWKIKLNNSKVEAAAERGVKKMLLSFFDNTCTNKLKHTKTIYMYYIL